MIRNYIKLTFRLLLQNKTFSLINIGGLAIAMACVLLIVLYITNELGYDRHHKNYKRIYRVAQRYIHSGETVEKSALTQFGLAPLLKNDFPFIKVAVRIGLGKETIKYKNKPYLEKKVCFVDTGFFQLFNYKFLIGDYRTAIKSPNTAVLSESTAFKYFGKQNPIGKIFELYDTPIKVTGVVEEAHNTHLSFNMLISMSTIEKRLPAFYHKFDYSGSHYTYLLLSKADNAKRLQNSMKAFVDRHISKETSIDYFLQPLKDIHLKSNILNEVDANGSITYVYVFALVALVILLVACINYTNLTTARSMVRIKEIGIRKVAGARRWQLVLQFLGESIIISFLSLIVACVMATFLLPLFNSLTEKQLSANIMFEWIILCALLAFTFLLGLIAGSYPAFLLSGFRLSEVLKGKIARSPKEGMLLRKSLLIGQFTVSVALLIGTILIFHQLSYIRNKDLGINPDQVIVIPVGNISGKFSTFKTELLTNPYIKSIGGVTNDLVSGRTNWSQYRIEGSDAIGDINMSTMIVDNNFLSTIQAKIISGRNFSNEYPLDSTKAYIINEAAAKLLQLEKPLNHVLSGNVYLHEDGIVKAIRKKGRIVGVVKDFHFTSLHTEIKPAVFTLPFDKKESLYFMMVRISGKDIRETIRHIENIYNKFDKDNTFAFSFMNEDIARLYLSEERFLKVFATFSILAILIASLGTLGLASYTVVQKTKEIGIRKVLGASSLHIVSMLSIDFVKLILVANLIAWPIAWWSISNWLDNFVYRITPPLWSCICGGSFALLIVMLTVWLLAIKASKANPVKLLRSE